jgi:hypothetical protein
VVELLSFSSQTRTKGRLEDVTTLTELLVEAQEEAGQKQNYERLQVKIVEG